VRKVEKLASGRYKVRFRMPGRETSQTFDRHADAKRFALLLDVLPPQAALDQMDSERNQATMPTMDDVAADHIRLLTNVTDGTRLTYTRLWARTWGPLIGNLPANHLAPDHLRAAVNTLATSYSAKSLANQRGLLAAVCKRAVEKKYLSGNPTKDLKLPRSGEVDRKEMRILTPDEFDTLLAGIHAHYQPLVRFLAGTGCRWGEAVALTVGDLALPDVRFRRALKWSPDNQRKVGVTKTPRSNRTIRLPAHVIADLDRITEDRKGADLVFTAPRGGPVQHRTFWSDIWLPATKQVPEPRPRIHDLRHTHAAWMLARGVPPHIVSRRLGHESTKTTTDVYGGLMPDAQLAAVAALDAVFGPPELD